MKKHPMVFTLPAPVTQAHVEKILEDARRMLAERSDELLSV